MLSQRCVVPLAYWSMRHWNRSPSNCLPSTTLAIVFPPTAIVAEHPTLSGLGREHKNSLRTLIGSSLCLRRQQIQTYGRAFRQQITAASALAVLRPLLQETSAQTHAPAPDGLPGGYAVTVGAQGVQVDLPAEVSLEQTIEPTMPARNWTESNELLLMVRSIFPNRRWQ